MNLEGTQLGHYRLTQFIKGGGMGEVYLAEDLTLTRQVAIKVVKTEGTLYPNSPSVQEAERLFQREMGVIAALDHPNILTLYEAGKQSVNNEQITYMVMPYCPAGSLADWMARYHSSSLLSPEEVSQLLLQAAEALQHAHDHNPSILHLDIKPQNFLVRRQQDPTALPNLLLADFGVSKITDTTQMSATPRGTMAYMAPEQLGMLPVPASDQYALAVMVYELLTGRRPFEGANMQVVIYQHANVAPDPPSKANSSLPQVLDPVILRALAKRPEQRFDSVREFAQAFAAVLKPEAGQRALSRSGYAGETETAEDSPPQNSVPPPPPPPRQRVAPSPYGLPPLSYQQPYAGQPQPGYQQPYGQQGYPPPQMVLWCPVCRTMAPLGTRRCVRCRTSLAGVVPTPISMPVNGQRQSPYMGGQQQAMQTPQIPAKERLRGQQQAMQPSPLPIKQRRKRKLGFWWALGLSIVAAALYYNAMYPHPSSGSVGTVAIIVFIVCLFI
jgi:serine/threonine protein kinase